MIIGYLAHDLTDAAVRRREAMLRAGGAEPRMAGLVRNGRALPVFADPSPLVLGASKDARLASRAVEVGRARASGIRAICDHFGPADAILARNLEMLALAPACAARIAARTGRRPRIVYECLDIHRLLTARSAAGRVLRALERRLAPSVDLVLTSSPAFVVHHLGKVFHGRTQIVENKVFLPQGAATAPAPAAPTPAGPPWRIGWFGALRCRTSFETLARIAMRGGGRVEVILRGRPSPDVFPDLPAEVGRHPHMRFEGPYDAARDLAAIYGEVHFAWCIDWFEQGRNSAWLLPNRLYESAFHRTVPIALGAVETGAVLRRRGCGIVVTGDPGATLDRLFAGYTAEDYEARLEELARQPPGAWSAGPEECAKLVATMTRTGPAPMPPRRPAGPSVHAG